MFPTTVKKEAIKIDIKKSRNPLKSGQCFLQIIKVDETWEEWLDEVAIPSNRVNVSYLQIGSEQSGSWNLHKSQSPQIGSMFPT